MRSDKHDQTSRQRTAGVFLLALLLALAFTATCAGSAGASPVWKFEGEELATSETVAGEAVLSSLTIPGLTTTCKKMHYEMTISNSEGTGKAELKVMAFKTCFTNSLQCTVKSMVAEKLPWAGSLTTVGASNYVFFEGIKVAIRYAGAECVLGGVLVSATGSAAGLYNNASETFTFDASSFKATKAELKALGSAIEWKGAFTTDATGAHKGEALEVG